MPVIHEITDLTAPELDVYARLTQAQLRNRLEPEKGIFIAESPKVIARALDAGYQPLSLLMERKQITGPAQEILTRCGDVPVYTADRELLAQLTGFALTRGVLCAFRRPAPRTVEQVCAHARRVAVLEGIVDSTNVGAIFRSAAALNMDAVLVTPSCCDPPPCGAGKHGHCVSGAVGADRHLPCRLAGKRQCPAPRAGLQDRCHGTERPLGQHRRPRPCRRAKACHRAGHRGRWAGQ